MKNQQENICPICGSTVIDYYENFELIEANRGFFKCQCLDCNATFIEWHILKFEKITNIIGA